MKSVQEKLHFDPENFDGKIVNGNFGLGSYVTVEINGKQYTRRVYDEPHVDLYIVIDNTKLYYQDFWDNSFNESLNEDFPDAQHREEHFSKHCVDGDSNEFSRSEYEDEYFYEAAANRLARTRAYTSDLNAPDEVVGFIQRDGAFVKYNKRTSGLVKFKPDRRFGGNVKIITYYKATPQRYKDIYNRKYYKEFN